VTPHPGVEERNRRSLGPRVVLRVAAPRRRLPAHLVITDSADGRLHAARRRTPFRPEWDVESGAFAPHEKPTTHSSIRADIVLAIVSAVLFFIAFLINAANLTTNDTFSSTNVMLLGLAVLALHVAGVGSGWAVRGRRR
jgi:hypothetical protein